MKSTRKLLIVVLALLALAASAYAQSPREQLQQMVEQLQKTPNDNALRERIIKLALTVKPSPALPDDAVRYTGRAIFVYKTAKSEADYLDAAREYERAVASAPWVANYYAELCTIYEKASKYAEAKRACDFALIGTTDSSQAVDLKQRIAGLEIGIERNSAGARAKRKREEFAGFLKSIEGAVFRTAPFNQWGAFAELRIKDGEYVRWASGPGNEMIEQRSRGKLTGFVATYTFGEEIAFSPDGNTVTETNTNGQVFVFRRVN